MKKKIIISILVLFAFFNLDVNAGGKDIGDVEDIHSIDVENIIE